MRKIIIILMVLLLTGCYDYNELNDLEIVSSIIVDKEDGMYVTHLEVLDTSDDADTGSYFLTGYGKTLESSLNNVFFDSAMKPFYSHMNALVFSEEVAKEGIDPFFDYLIRGTDFRKDFYLYVAQDVDDILEYETQPKESIGEILKTNTLKNGEQNGRYKSSNLREVTYHYLRENPYIIGEFAIEDETIILTDSYIFNDNKMDFRIEKEAALLANLLDQKNKSFNIYNDYSYTIHEFKVGKDIKKDKIEISIKGNARVTSADGDNSLSPEELLKLEKDLNKTIENDFKETIAYARKMGVDIFNLNYHYYLHYPKDVKDDTWKDIEVEIKSDVSISEKGLLLHTLGGSKDGK